MLADIQDVKVRAVAAELVETGLSASSAEVDVCDPDSVRQMVAQTVDRHGRIDVLINDAAIDAPPGLEWEETDEHWNRIIDTDLSGAWWCTKSVIPHMIRARRGRIIFISSVSARVGDLRTSVAYNAAKAGLIGLTIGLSLQLERYGILVNAIAPGATGNTGQPVEALSGLQPGEVVHMESDDLDGDGNDDLVIASNGVVASLAVIPMNVAIPPPAERKSW